jgi:hypothetical protein
MKIVWSDGGNIHRAYLKDYVTIKTCDWGGALRPHKVNAVGLVQQYQHYAGKWLAQVYGSINPDCHGASFDNIDDAKAYVETQALLGIAINKLTR